MYPDPVFISEAHLHSSERCAILITANSPRKDGDLMLYAVIGVLAAVCVLLTIKIVLMRRSAREIISQLDRILSEDTNAVIGITSSDKTMRALAAELDRRLRQLRREQLRYINGDRELKEAVTNISHDLRTPLTAIMGYLDMMKRCELPDQVRDYLAIIEERANAMKQLTEELFRYSVLLSSEGTPDAVPTDVGKALEESILSHYAALKARGIVPEVEICEKKIIRELDPAALSRVFSNLFSNALKYSSGDLSITLAEPCIITFSNSAPGLGTTQVERLFDRFYTVEAARTGTGLGLAIAKNFVEKMGGSITAKLEGERLAIVIEL